VVTIEFQVFINFLIAVALGALVGMQREYEIQTNQRKDFAGLRTFSLISLFGATASFISMNVLNSSIFLYVTFGSVMLLIVAAYIAMVFHFKENEIGITTEISAILTFLMGALCLLGFALPAVIITIIMVIFLAMKKPLHRFASKIKIDEVYATIKFAVITILVLPFLPNVNYTPMNIPILSKIIEAAPFLSVEIAKQLDVFNPFKIWLMVVFISGISFIGYLLIRVVGTGKGLGLTGFLGGLVSSTAVTSSMSLESKKNSKIVYPFVFAVIIACSTMFIRVIVEILVVNSSLLRFALIPMFTMGAAGFIAALIVWKKYNKNHIKNIEFDSPFTLAPALKFALFFAFVLFIAKFGYVMFGAKGVYIAALLSGLADVDAITLSMATLALAGDLSGVVATIAIAIAAMTNTVVKAGITYMFGGNKFRKATLTIFGIVVGVGLISLIFLFI
jgi:uncharacterized membrane protein (DUF4010 family)